MKKQTILDISENIELKYTVSFYFLFSIAENGNLGQRTNRIVEACADKKTKQSLYIWGKMTSKINIGEQGRKIMFERSRPILFVIYENVCESVLVSVYGIGHNPNFFYTKIILN